MTSLERWLFASLAARAPAGRLFLIRLIGSISLEIILSSLQEANNLLH
jgi:hypothetical protein